MSTPSDVIAPDHLEHNRRWWNRRAEDYQIAHAEQLPTRNATWGVFSTPNAGLGALGDTAGKDVVELGAGGAQFSIALARAGARCTAIDLSPEQLKRGEALLEAAEAEDGSRPEVTLVEANAEETGLPSNAFDVAFSDYGASMFADPHLWIAEAARLLRPGGRLAFSCITPLLELCWDPRKDVTNELVHDYFGMHRIEDDMVMFNLPYGEWIRVLRRNGFSIVDLIETRPADDMVESTYRSQNQLNWSRHWPAEMIWVADLA